MGAWGTGPFDSDGAGDWVFELGLEDEDDGVAAVRDDEWCRSFASQGGALGRLSILSQPHQPVRDAVVPCRSRISRKNEK